MKTNLYNRSSGNLIHHKLRLSNKFDGMRVSTSIAYRNTRLLRPISGSHIGLNATCKQGQTLIKWVQLIRGLLFQQDSACTYTLVQVIQVGQELVQSIDRKKIGEVRQAGVGLNRWLLNNPCKTTQAQIETNPTCQANDELDLAH